MKSWWLFKMWPCAFEGMGQTSIILDISPTHACSHVDPQKPGLDMKMVSMATSSLECRLSSHGNLETWCFFMGHWLTTLPHWVVFSRVFFVAFSGFYVSLGCRASILCIFSAVVRAQIKVLKVSLLPTSSSQSKSLGRAFTSVDVVNNVCLPFSHFPIVW